MTWPHSYGECLDTGIFTDVLVLEKGRILLLIRLMINAEIEKKAGGPKGNPMLTRIEDSGQVNQPIKGQR